MRAQNKFPNRLKYGFAADCLCLTPVCMAALLATGFGQLAQALPQGGQVVAGSAAINAAGVGKLEIKQASDSASIDWRSFSVGAAESLRIMQPSSNSVLVNRVTGNDASQILGRIDANGRVFLSNPRGIVFGRDAVIDVGGLVATTLAIRADQGGAVAGSYSLTGGTEAPGEIIVDGVIRAPGGTVVFAGPQVSLNGQIEARRVAAAAVNAVQIDIDGDGLVFFKPRNDEQLDAKLKVLGKIQADGGTVDLRAAARAGLADTVLNMDGVVQARSIGSRNGQVFINGGAVGDTVVTGKIDVSAQGAGERGGEVRVLGQRVGLFDSAAIDASGVSGGGLVHVGGGFKGLGEPLNASLTVVGPKASINASATDKGDGGQVAVWADGHTGFAGAIEARGGANGGDGGFVETSGKQTLSFSGAVDTRAPRGSSGSLLLDPTDITIQTGGPDNVDRTGNTFSDTSSDGSHSKLKISTLEAALASNNILVDASTGSGTDGGSITVSGSVAWSSANSLTLNASTTITIGSTISNTGVGGIALQANGAVALNSAVSLAGGAFTVRGTSGGSTRAASFTAGATGTITTTGAADVPGGAVSILTSGNVSTRAVTSSAGVVGAGAGLNGGSITLDSSAGSVTNLGALTSAGSAAFGGSGLAGGNGGALALTAGSAITLTGAVSSIGGSGDGGGASGNGGQLSLTAAGGVSQASVITAGSLSVANTAAATDLSTSINQIGTLGTITATGQTFSFNNGLAIAQTGPIQAASATFDAGAHAINLTHANNDFTGPVSLTNTGSNNVQVTDVNALTLGTLSVAAGNLTVTSAGALNLGTGAIGGNLVAASNSGAITQAAGGLIVSGTSSLNAGAAAITLIDNANNFTGAVSVTNTGAFDVQVKDVDTLPLGTLSVAAGNLTVTSTGALNLGTGTVGANLVAASNGGAITQAAGGLIVTGSSSLNAGAATITLIDNANNFSGAVSLSNTGSNNVQMKDVDALALGTLSVAAGNLTVTSSGALNLGTGSVGGNLLAASNGGAITQTTGGLIVTGTSSLNAGAAAITLIDNANNFTGAVSVTNTGAFDVQVKDVDGLTLGTLSVASGNLTVTSTGALNLGTGTVGGNLIAASNGGAITQAAGGLLVTGSTGLNAGAAAITLIDNSNNFTGAVSLSNTGSNDLQVKDVDALALGTLSIAAGNLTVTSAGALNLGTGAVGGNLVATSNGGAITQAAGGLMVTGTAGLNAGAAAITLTDNANNFTGAVSVTNTGAFDVQVKDVDALTLGTLSVATGNLTVTSTGALNLGTGTVGGNLVAGSNGGAITQTVGGLSITGSTGLNAGAAAITLIDNANNFTGAVSVTNTGAFDVQVKDVDALTLGTLSVATGNLTVTSSGALNLGTGTVGGNLIASSNGGTTTQAAGGLIVTGTASLNAGAAAITLTDNANNFGGAVSATNTGAFAVQLTDANAIELGSVNTANDLTVNAVGISQNTAGLTVVGTSILNAGAGAIALTTSGNDFTGAVTLNSTGASAAVRDANNLTLATPTLGANTGLTAIAGQVLTLPAVAISTGNGSINLQSNSGTLATAGTLSTNSGSITLLGSTGLTVADNLATSSGAISLTGGPTGGLTVNGGVSVSAGNGTIALDGMDGAINLPGALSTSNATSTAVQILNASAVALGNISAANGTVTLGGAGGNSLSGAVSQTSGTTVTAASLIGNTGSTVTMGVEANQIGTLAAFTTIGAFSLNDAGAGLIVSGPVNSGTAAITLLTSGGALALNGNISAGAASLTGAGITQQAGSTVNAGSGDILLNASNAAISMAGALTSSSAASAAVQIFGGTTTALGNISAANGTVTLGGTGGNSLSGAVSQTSGTTVTAASLIGNAGSTVAMGVEANQIGTLAAFTTVGAFSLNDAGAGLIVSGPVNSGTAATTFATSGGALALNGNISAGAASLTGAGITQQAGSTVNAGSGDILLNASNAAISMAGSLTTSSAANTAVQILDATSAALGNINAANGTVTLGGAGGNNLSGAVTQTSGTTVTAASLTGNTGSTVGMGVEANQLGTLAAFTTGGAFSLNDVGAGLIVSGPVNSGTAATTLATSGGALALNGNISAGAASLTGAGITQQAGSTVNAGGGDILLNASNAAISMAGSLTTSSAASTAVQILDATSAALGNINAANGTVTLGGAGGNDLSGAVTQTPGTTISAASLIGNVGSTLTLSETNALANLGAFSSSGGFSLVDAGGLTVNGAVVDSSATSSITTNGNLSLAVTTGSVTGVGVTLVTTGGGNIALAGNVNAGTGTAQLTSAGNISRSAGVVSGSAVTLDSATGVTANTAANTLAARSSSGGAVTITEADGVTLSTIGGVTNGAAAGAAYTVTAAGTITVASALNSGAATGSTSLSSTGGALSLAADVGNGGAAGHLNLSAATGINQTAGNLRAGGSSTLSGGAGAITVNGALNDFSGALSLSNLGANPVAVRDANDIQLAASTVGGNLAVTAGGHITQLATAGVLTVPGSSIFTVNSAATGQKDVLLANANNNLSGAVTIDVTGGGTLHDVGLLNVNASPSALSFPTTSLHNLDLRFIAAPIELPALTLTGNLNLLAGGSVTQLGAFLVGGNTTVAAGTAAVTLDNAANQFTGAVSSTGQGAVTLKNSIATILGAMGSSGMGNAAASLAVTTSDDTVTQSAAAFVSGTSTVAAGSGAVTLDDAGNQFAGAIASTGTGAVTLKNSIATLLGSVGSTGPGNAAASLSVTTSDDAVTQSAAAFVSGSSSVAAGNAAVTLDHIGNQFSGAVSSSGRGAVTLKNSIDTVLGAIGSAGTGNAAASLIVIAGSGAVTQSRPALVSGSSSVSAGSGTGAISLNATGNDFGGPVSLSGAATEIVDSNALTLASLATGALTVTSSGALNLGSGTAASIVALSHGGVVSQNGALTVIGSSSVDAGASAITLTQPNNDFQALLSLTGGTVQLTDKNGLNVQLLSSGHSSLLAGGELAIGGTTAGLTSTTTVGATRFGNSTVNGDLNVSSASTVGQSSGTSLQVSGGSNITATGSDVMLEGNNDFGGPLSVSSANVGVRDLNALNVQINASGNAAIGTTTGALALSGSTAGSLSTNSGGSSSFGSTTVGATLTAASGGDLSQTGALNVAGPATLSSTTGSINLDRPGNDFKSTVTANALAAGQTMTLVDANALTLNLNAGGAGAVTTLTGPLTVAGSTGTGLQLESGGTLTFGVTHVGTSLTATAAGAMTQTGALTTGAASSIKSTVASIALDNAANDFVGSLSATAAQDVTLVDSNSLSLSLNAGRAGLVTASAGELAIAGSTGTTLSTGSGTGTRFGPTMIGAALSSLAAGDVAQTGSLTVAGSAAITSSAGSVTLADAGNDFVGALALTAAGDATVVDANALQLGLNVGGSASAAAIAGGLTVAGSTGASLASRSASNISFGTTDVGRNLSASSEGSVAQTGAIRASGLELNGAASFTLEHAGNQLSKIAARSGNGSGSGAADGAISIVNASGISVDSVATSVGIVRTGNVALRTLSGDITLAQGISTGDAKLTLQSTGLVSQAAGKTIHAVGLELLGTGAFTLIESTNEVVRIAIGGSAGHAGTDGAVSYVNATALQVDQVNASVGVARSGDVSLSALSGVLRLNEAINTGAANLTLHSNAAVTQAAGKAISAGGLELKGSGSFTLADAGNNVARLAMASGGASDGAIQYLDADALAVDTVNSVGASRSGDVSLRSLMGDITLAQPLSLPGKTLRLDSAAGAVTQSGGKISAADLGLRAAGNIALNQSNAVSGKVAARSETGDVLLQNANGYVIGNVAADGSLFAGANGFAAPAAGKSITLLTSAGVVTQAAGSNLTASGLELQGAAAYTLNNLGNNIAKFSATQGGAGDGAINYVDADGFELSSVGAVGVTRSGTVELSNEAGRLSLAPQAASIVSVNGGSIAIASPQAVDGKISLPVFTLSGNISLSKGALSLKALKASKADDDMFAKYRNDIGIAKEIILVDAVGRPIKILADVIVQTGGSIKVANDGRLNLLAEQGGSASLLEAGNDFAGGLSANLAGAKAGAGGTAEESLPRSLLRLRGSTVNLGGEGANADAAYIAADRLTTMDAAVITARMSYSNTLGTRTQMPALVFDMGPNAFDGTQTAPFGAHPSANIRVKVGTEVIPGQTQSQGQAGFASVRPSATLDAARTQSLVGKRAAIFLAGPETGVAGYLFFYDGAGSQLEIPIYYNGYAPSSPQVEGALSSIASVSEAARRDRFEEAVRTENVAARLRGGVISEVGPGSPATSGSSGAAAPKSCDMTGSEGSEMKLKCKI
jgi:filamentous hemagglutinin family protein